MLTLALLAFALVGCAPTCEDIEGAVCVDDVAAMQARIDQLEAAGTAYAWFDQDGVQVTDGPDLVWFDDAGVLWQVDVDAGEPTALATEYDLAGFVYHLTADCSDPAMYGGLPAPKIAFYNGSARDDYPILIRDASLDEVDAVAVAFADEDDGVCRGAVSTREQHLVPTSAVRELGRPDIVWPAPLFPAAL